MFTPRNPPATTSSRGDGWSKRLGSINRIVQMGIQRRSMPHVQDAVAHVQGRRDRHDWDGPRLDLQGTTANWSRPNPRRSRLGSTTRCGKVPAPDRPFMTNHFHYNWHWFWNWGTGRTRQQRDSRPGRRPLGTRRRRPVDRLVQRRQLRLPRPRGALTPRSSPGSSPTVASSGSIVSGINTRSLELGFGIAFHG